MTVPNQPTDPTDADKVVLPIPSVETVTSLPDPRPQEARSNPAPVVHGSFAEVTAPPVSSGPQGPTKSSPFAEVEKVELEVKHDAEEALTEVEKLATEAKDDAEDILNKIEDKGPAVEDPTVEPTPAEDPLNGAE